MASLRRDGVTWTLSGVGPVWGVWRIVIVSRHPGDRIRVMIRARAETPAAMLAAAVDAVGALPERR